MPTTGSFEFTCAPVFLGNTLYGAAITITSAGCGPTAGRAVKYCPRGSGANYTCVNGVVSGSTINFLNVYATRLGATGYQIGLIGAMSAVVTLFLAIPAGRWRRTSRATKTFPGSAPWASSTACTANFRASTRNSSSSTTKA